MAKQQLTVTQWFEKYTIPVTESGCWIFLGSCAGKGYGWFKRDGAAHLAHRFAYELVNGSVSSRTQICHKCDVRSCVRPDHLYAGNNSTNQRDAVKRRRHPKSAKTHCPQGHEYSAESSKVKNGARYCRTCNGEWDRLRIARARATLRAAGKRNRTLP